MSLQMPSVRTYACCGFDGTSAACRHRPPPASYRRPPIGDRRYVVTLPPPPSSTTKNSAAEAKAAKSISLIVLLFVVSWLPLYTTNTVMYFCPDCAVPSRLILAAIILSHFNSAVNPALYAWAIRDFRDGLVVLVAAGGGTAWSRRRSSGTESSLLPWPRRAMTTSRQFGRDVSAPNLGLATVSETTCFLVTHSPSLSAPQIGERHLTL